MHQFQNVVWRYLVALVAVGAVLVVKLVLAKGFDFETRYLLLLGAVLVGAYIGGLGPGVAALVLSALAANFAFLRDLFGVMQFEAEQQIRLSLFLLEGVVIIVLCETLRRARRNAETSAREAEQLEREVLRITDTERARIGHDLHDGLGQHLTGTAYLAAVLRDQLGASMPRQAESAGQIAALLGDAVRQTRDMARGLSPLAVERAGLVGALRDLSETTQKRFGLPVTLRLEGLSGDEGEIDSPHAALSGDSLETHLLRIAQEAVNNAARHAKPSAIEITLSRRGNTLRLCVEDDGAGMPAGVVRLQRDAENTGGGMGLRIMRYRAHLIGARIEINTRSTGSTSGGGAGEPSSLRPGGGTRVLLTLEGLPRPAAPTPDTASPRNPALAG